jgi:hypothetical protein
MIVYVVSFPARVAIFLLFQIHTGRYTAVLSSKVWSWQGIQGPALVDKSHTLGIFLPLNRYMLPNNRNWDITRVKYRKSARLLAFGPKTDVSAFISTCDRDASQPEQYASSVV